MIPKSYNDCTVYQYKYIQDVLKSGLKPHERNSKLIEFFTGKDVKSISYNERDVYVDLISDILNSKPSHKIKKYIWVKGQQFEGVADVSKFNTNVGITLETIIKDGAEPVINNLCALCFYPKKLFKKAVFDGDKYEYYSNLFLEAKIGDIFGTVFFYSRVYERLELTSLLYMEEINQTIEEMMNQNPNLLQELGLADSNKITAGIMS